MDIKGKRIGFALTGSFCTFERVLQEMRNMVKGGADIVPIMSFNSCSMDTKFGNAEYFIKEIKKISGKEIITTIQEAEPIGPQKMTDIMLVAPCSGNTIAKLANNIVDTPVTMAIKSHLRNEKPVVIAISTNDGLAGSAENIGKLLNRKHYFVVPFKQDNPITKPRSLVFDDKYIIKTVQEAFENRQIQPVLV